MSVWADKFRPKSFEELGFHEDISYLLLKIQHSGEVPHMLFYGPSGSGKRTRIRTFLTALFGEESRKVTLSTKMVPVNDAGKKIEISILSSHYHVEVNLADVGNYDRQVIQHLIKEIAETKAVSFSNPQHSQDDDWPTIKGNSSSSSASSPPPPPFKIIVLTEVERLSAGAQQALRRTMEQQMSTCRLILCSQNSSRVSRPLQSRCFLIRVSAPTEQEIIPILQRVATLAVAPPGHLPPQGQQGPLPATIKQQQAPSPLSLSTAQRIARESCRNLRTAILLLEATYIDKKWDGLVDPPPMIAGPLAVVKPGYGSSKLGSPPEWERVLDEMAFAILEEQSPARLLAVRGKLYQLLANCVPPDLLLKTLLISLLRRLDDRMSHELVRLAAVYDHKLKVGTKPIFHIEAFVSKFMTIYKKWLIEQFPPL